MRFRVKTTGWLVVFLVFVGLILGLLLGKAEFLQDRTTLNPETAISSQYPDFQPDIKTVTSNPQTALSSQNSKPQPEVKTATPNPQTALSSPNSKPQPQQKKNPKSKAQKTPNNPVKTTAAFRAYRPRYEISWANPTNFGERFTTDVYGTPINNQPIIVLHETAAPASSVLNFFQTPHDDENVQASYHTMITLDGTVVYIIPPEKRAFGAANSVFDGPLGSETVKTHPQLPPSVNNFAYHVGLETPPSGLENHEQTHSGYTEAQYRSLAWLIAQSNVPDERITTHRTVDRSGQRIDPRSFDFNKFLNVLHSFRGASQIN
ncbi:N-acetylmuramoyl-L-alanine amidase [Mastigocladopsis repens]|uniref:N-acetylmuramoyl-L-alanine amidase n=1 Tax=Mastigocladopsis repens TaxID=221287 RepID=UPI0002DB6489|nr:peptidoglycan recognition family protein [Mastigocladopsis repens]